MFTAKTYGKWILCGEHAVLRGGAAIVFPLANYSLELQYEPSSTPLEIKTNLPDCKKDFIKTWQHAWSKLINHSPYATTGILSIKSNIPIGQGMGASAALCLAITRCLIDLTQKDINPWAFAKNLENLFHGQSSGLDILGVGSFHGELFKNQAHRPIKLGWQPHWALSPSKEVGATSDTIKIVKKLIDEKPQTAFDIDQNMQESVEMALKALETKNINLLLLANSMKIAHDCFMAWGLITARMKEEIKKLYQMGALAVKPTGSGGGGYLLSLWSPEQFEKRHQSDSFIKINLPNDNTSHLL
jgi:mevalonate kinase